MLVSEALLLFNMYYSTQKFYCSADYSSVIIFGHTNTQREVVNKSQYRVICHVLFLSLFMTGQVWIVSSRGFCFLKSCFPESMCSFFLFDDGCVIVVF